MWAMESRPCRIGLLAGLSLALLVVNGAFLWKKKECPPCRGHGENTQSLLAEIAALQARVEELRLQSRPGNGGGAGQGANSVAQSDQPDVSAQSKSEFASLADATVEWASAGCSPQTCSGHGACRTSAGVFRCACAGGWGARDCSVRRGPLEELVTFVHDCVGFEERAAAPLLPSLKKFYPGAKVLTTCVSPHSTAVPVPRGAGLGGRLNALVAAVKTPYFMLLLDTPYLYEESDIRHLLNMSLEFPFDLVGGFGVDGENVMHVPCYRMSHSKWAVVHSPYEFGYDRHEGRCMVCDRTSNSFLANTRRFRDTIGGFDDAVGGTAMTDLFLRIHKYNLAANQGKDGRKGIPFTVGTCPETLLPNKTERSETFTNAFRDKFQVEYIIYPNGTESELKHVKYCHECGLYTRESQRRKLIRDLHLVIDLWADPTTLGGVDKWHTVDGTDGNMYRAAIRFGGLLGSVRGVGLIPWDFDIDFELISLNTSLKHAAARFERVVLAKLRGLGWSVETGQGGTHCDCQHVTTGLGIDLRSWVDSPPVSKVNTGTLAVDFLGRRFYAGGYANPAKFLRHLYKDHFLAMRMHSKAPLHCLVKGHAACVPDCRLRPDNKCGPGLPNFCTPESPQACAHPFDAQAALWRRARAGELPALEQP